MSIRCKRGCGFVHDERDLCPTTQAVIDSLQRELAEAKLLIGVVAKLPIDGLPQLALENTILEARKYMGGKGL